MSTLIFVDTNVYLDFYRVPGGEKDLSILTKLESHIDILVTTHQVEMEFKKNRQKVILEAHRDLKAKIQNQQFPAFLSSSKQAAALRKNEQSIQRLAQDLQKRVGKVLTTPTLSDPVYKCTQRIFKADSDYNLRRENKVRFTIRRLARKRFLLGYPPRKGSDLSIGDAVNWEWVISCANAKKYCSNIVIVTRDKDFGEEFNGKPIINDWLRQEFKERVSKKRNIEVTNRLSEAMKKANIKVTPAEKIQEEKLIRERTLEQFEGRGRFYKSFESLSSEEELVLGHLYYEQKQSMPELVKNTALPKKTVEKVVENLSHIIEKDTNDRLAARVIDMGKARDLVVPASKQRNE
ncbi:PIN domain-containing protein [Nitrospira sp. M1]